MDDLARELAEEPPPVDLRRGRSDRHDRGAGLGGGLGGVLAGRTVRGKRLRAGGRVVGGAVGQRGPLGWTRRMRRERPRRAGRRSVPDDARDAATLEALATLEELELDEEREADDLARRRSTRSIVPADGAAGREQVVDDEDLLARA